MIALAGAEKDDLHNAKWAQIPRQDYVDAARPILRCFSGRSLLNHNNINRGHTAFVIQLRSYLYSVIQTRFLHFAQHGLHWRHS